MHRNLVLRNIVFERFPLTKENKNEGITPKLIIIDLESR